MERDVSRFEWDDLFTADLPRQWSWSRDEGVVIIFRSDGVGALQVSVLKRDDLGQSPREAAIQLAQEFAQQRYWDLPDHGIHASSVAGNSMTMFAFTEHGDIPTYWQVWHIVGADRAAFITYTCDPTDSAVEDAERQGIVDSFRWLQSIAKKKGQGVPLASANMRANRAMNIFQGLVQAMGQTVTTEVAAYVCSHVFNDTRPVLLVSRAGGDWQFLCGGTHEAHEVPKPTEPEPNRMK